MRSWQLMLEDTLLLLSFLTAGGALVLWFILSTWLKHFTVMTQDTEIKQKKGKRKCDKLRKSSKESRRWSSEVDSQFKLQPVCTGSKIFTFFLWILEGNWSNSDLLWVCVCVKKNPVGFRLVLWPTAEAKRVWKAPVQRLCFIIFLLIFIYRPTTTVSISPSSPPLCWCTVLHTWRTNSFFI